MPYKDPQKRMETKTIVGMEILKIHKSGETYSDGRPIPMYNYARASGINTDRPFWFNGKYGVIGGILDLRGKISKKYKNVLDLRLNKLPV